MTTEGLLQNKERRSLKYLSNSFKMEVKKIRSSKRTKKFSSSMKVVDEETRRQVQLALINNLEEDTLFQDKGGNKDEDENMEDFILNEEDEEEDAFSTTKKRKKKSKKKEAMIPSRTIGQRKSQRPKIKLEQIFSHDFYEDDMNFPNYLSIVAGPSRYPARHFCSVCSFFSKYTCIRCGMYYCSLKCSDIHRETRCVKFAE